MPIIPLSPALARKRMPKLTVDYYAFAFGRLGSGAFSTFAPLGYYNNEKEVGGFLAAPGGTGKHPGMILIHEWWGLNDNIRQNAMAFAKLGYVALAVDL